MDKQSIIKQNKDLMEILIKETETSWQSYYIKTQELNDLYKKADELRSNRFKAFFNFFNLKKLDIQIDYIYLRSQIEFEKYNKYMEHLSNLQSEINASTNTEKE